MEKFTAGYDAVILVNVKTLNDAATALFYDNFLTFNEEIDFGGGPKALPKEYLDKVPSNLKPFLKVRLRCKLLHEPLFQFLAGSGNKSYITMSAHIRLYAWMMDGLELKFDADIALKGEFDFKYSCSEQMLSFPLKADLMTQFDVKLADNSGSSLDIKNIQDIFKPAINRYFDNREPIQFTLPSFRSYLPNTKQIPDNEFTAKVVNVKVTDYQQLAVAVNFLNRSGGDINALVPFSSNSSVSLAVSERALRNCFDFYCTRMNHEIYSISGRKENALATVIGVTDVVIKDVIGWLGTKVTSFGFKETHVRYIDSAFYGSLRVVLASLPRLEFHPGNIISIKNIDLSLVVTAGIEVNYKIIHEDDTNGWIPDGWCGKGDVVTKIEKKKDLIGVENLEIIHPKVKEISAEFVMDDVTNALTLKIKKLKLDQIFSHCNAFATIADVVLVEFSNWISAMIVNLLPKFYLTPPLYLPTIPTLPWPVSITRSKFEFGDGAVRAGVGLSFHGLQTITEPMPKYIANINNHEVHRVGCPCVYDIYETHQRGYYSLQQALSAGYDGCKNCLPAYHKR